jgi:hypothetical protein
VAALGTTSGTLSGSEEGSGRVFPCEACGADLVFDAARQVLRCTRCEFTRDVRLDGAPPVQEQDLTQALERMSRERHGAAVALPAEAALLRQLRRQGGVRRQRHQQGV